MKHKLLHASRFKIQANMNYKSPLLWVGVIIVLLALWFIGAYNRFVSMSGAIDGQWAQVEAQYQRRFDLIPNLCLLYTSPSPRD